MTHFQCIAIDTRTAERFRSSGTDDRGNAVRRMAADRPGGFPCRHCLQPAAQGETMLLGSFDLPRPLGIYWTPSPIFVHADGCERFLTANEVAPTVRRNPLVSVRAYDGAEQCLYDLGEVCAGEAVDAPLARALADERTVFVNVHTARPGCWLCRVERAERFGALRQVDCVGRLSANGS